MLYKIWGKRKHVILPLNFDLLKFYLTRKKMNLDQYLNQREKGKTKQNQSSLFCMAKPFCFSL